MTLELTLALICAALPLIATVHRAYMRARRTPLEGLNADLGEARERRRTR